MGTLKDANPDVNELMSQILDEDLLWNAVDAVTELLSRKAIKKVQVTFGYILDRDLAVRRNPQIRPLN